MQKKSLSDKYTYLSGCKGAADTALAADDRRLSANARGTGKASSSTALPAVSSIASAPPSAPLVVHVSHDPGSGYKKRYKIK